MQTSKRSRAARAACFGIRAGWVAGAAAIAGWWLQNMPVYGDAVIFAAGLGGAVCGLLCRRETPGWASAYLAAGAFQMMTALFSGSGMTISTAVNIAPATVMLMILDLTVGRRLRRIGDRKAAETAGNRRAADPGLPA